MKPLLNTHALSATRIQSASIGVLGVVLHPMTVGEYEGSIFSNNQLLKEFSVKVDAKYEVDQIDVDLAGSKSAEMESLPTYTLRDRGYLVLHNSWGQGGYHVSLARRAEGGERSQADFDSRRLQPGDLFVVTLLRPGLYAVESAATAARVRVMYPVPGKKPLAPAPSEMVISGDKIEPSQLDVQSTQPIVFAVKSKNVAISVTLREPDDGKRPAKTHVKLPRRLPNDQATKQDTEKSRTQKPNKRRAPPAE